MITSPDLEPRANIQRHHVRGALLPVDRHLRSADRRACGVPPGGHVLGVYARTDTERGVFKAPANEIVRGALDARRSTSTTARRTILNPRGVNAIRSFPAAASASGARAR